MDEEETFIEEGLFVDKCNCMTKRKNKNQNVLAVAISEMDVCAKRSVKAFTPH
jgi:hypothetical protein